MELDELKHSWEQYDKKLTENLRLNEELLRRSNLDRSRREMNTTETWVWYSVIVAAVLVIFLLRWTMLNSGEPLYLISGGVSALYFLISVVYGIRETTMLRKIDYYNAPVLELQKQLLAFTGYYNKIKKYELFTAPVIIFPALIVAGKIFHNVNILDSPMRFIISAALAIAGACSLLILFYRDFYDKKVKAAQQFLSQLQEFGE